MEHRFQNSKWIGTTKTIRFTNRLRLKRVFFREFLEIIRLRFFDDFLLAPPSFIQATQGFIDTNLGFALVVKAEKDKAGNYAPTLKTLIKENKIDDEVIIKLDYFCQQILAYNFVVSDLHPGNLVYAYNETLGNHFVIIDGVGDKSFIPILRYFHYSRKIIKLRLIKKLREHLGPVDI